MDAGWDMQATGNKAQDQSGTLSRVSIVLLALGIMMVAGLLAAFRVRQDREVTLENAHRELGIFATSLGLQVEAMLADGVGAATGAAAALRLQLPGQEQQPLLAAMLTGGDYVRALFVVLDGRMLLASRPDHPPAAGSLPAPDELAGTPGEIWFGHVQDPGTGEQILPVARRLGAGSGDWAGALIRISDLNEVYTHLQRVQSTVGLVTIQGQGLVQLPTTNESLRNVDISRSSIFQQFLREPEQELTLLSGAHFDTGDARLYAAYRLKNLPLIASSGRDRADALLGWKARTATLVQFLVLWTSVAVALAIGLQMLVNRRWRHLRGLAAAEARVAQAQRAELAMRQSLTRELLVAQERERQRLAGELHDGIGQNLSLLRNRVVQLRRAGLGQEALEQARELLDLATQTIEDLRGVAHNLRPMHLEELGLASALRTLAQRVESASDLQVHVRIEDIDDVLQGEAAVHVYRIAQEALNNVMRHAHARNLWVEVIRDIDRVEMRIRDDGRGIAAEKPRNKGLGLSSIHERGAILGAGIDLLPGDPSGTLLVLSIPLQVCEDTPELAAAGGADG